MSKKYFLFAFATIVLSGTAALAQRPATQPSPRPAAPVTPQTVAAPIPEGRMALIYSEDFKDPKNGIARYNAIMNSLAAEFQPRQAEVTQMAQRMKALQDEIAKLQAGGAPVAPAQIEAKVQQYEQLKKDYQRKGEDGQAAYKKRYDEVMTPLNTDISKALEAYAKARNITLIIDGNQVPLVYAVDNIDITRSFISEFNSKNPATASATPRP